MAGKLKKYLLIFQNQDRDIKPHSPVSKLHPTSRYHQCQLYHLYYINMKPYYEYNLDDNESLDVIAK